MHGRISRWRHFIGGCLLLGAGLAFGDTEVSLPNTREFILNSPETGRDYLIQVALPRGTQPENGFPVLYVLDGNVRFPLALAARENLFHGGRQDDPSTWMIVAIGYPGAERLDRVARTEDYTPPASDLSDTGDLSGHPQGGAGRFLTFIEQRLKPELVDRFPIDESRQALFGHSYGGLFTLYAMLERPQAFSDYIAISPSLWWNGLYLLHALDAGVERQAQALAGRRVLIGVGELEQSPQPGDEGTAQAARRQANAMIDNAHAAAAELLDRVAGLEVAYVCFPNENHGSVVWPAMRSAMSLLHDQAIAWRTECGD